MYAKIENNAVVEYPLTEHEIKSRFPDTLFTTDFASCLPQGYVLVLQATSPASDLVVATESAPALVEGSWVQTWASSDRYTAEELASQEQKKTADKWTNMRSERDQALEESAWVLERHREQKELNQATSITDIEYAAWLTYRQQLRDFPATVVNIDNYALPSAPRTL